RLHLHFEFRIGAARRGRVPAPLPFDHGLAESEVDAWIHIAARAEGLTAVGIRRHLDDVDAELAARGSSHGSEGATHCEPVRGTGLEAALDLAGRQVVEKRGLVQVGLGSERGLDARGIDLHDGGHIDVVRAGIGTWMVESLEPRARAVDGTGQLDVHASHIEAAPEEAQVAAAGLDSQRSTRVHGLSRRLLHANVSLELERDDRIRVPSHPHVFAELDGDVEIDRVDSRGLTRLIGAHTDAEAFLKIEALARGELDGLQVRTFALLRVDRGLVHGQVGVNARLADVARYRDPAIELRLGLRGVDGHEAVQLQLQIHGATAGALEHRLPARRDRSAGLDARALQSCGAISKREQGPPVLELD